MPRKPTVRYWSSRKGYCVKVAGVQHQLAAGPDDAPCGPVYLEAIDAFKRLMEKDSLPTAGDGNTVRAVLDAYLQAIEGKRKPGHVPATPRRLQTVLRATRPLAMCRNQTLPLPGDYYRDESGADSRRASSQVGRWTGRNLREQSEGRLQLGRQAATHRPQSAGDDQRAQERHEVQGADTDTGRTYHRAEHG